MSLFLLAARSHGDCPMIANYDNAKWPPLQQQTFTGVAEYHMGEIGQVGPWVFWSIVVVAYEPRLKSSINQARFRASLIDDFSPSFSKLSIL